MTGMIAQSLLRKAIILNTLYSQVNHFVVLFGDFFRARFPPETLFNLLEITDPLGEKIRPACQCGDFRSTVLPVDGTG